MSTVDPAVVALVSVLARAAAAEAIEEGRRNPPDRASGTPVEVAAARRTRRRVSDETALRGAVEAALAAGAAPIRAELFLDGRILLFFDGPSRPENVAGWREVLDALARGENEAGRPPAIARRRGAAATSAEARRAPEGES